MPVSPGLGVTAPSVPFVSHATDLLDYLAGEVRVVLPPSPLPAALAPFSVWTAVRFNH